MKKQMRFKAFLWMIFLGLLTLTLSVLSMNAFVISQGVPIFNSVESSPSGKIALVLGARVYNNSLLSHVLEDRVLTAVNLYHAGKVEKILMSGAHPEPHYNEVGAMLKYALERGVPAEDIFLDHAGFSTYESMYRAQHIFGVTNAIIITQRFHLARSVYTARAFNIDATGLVADRRPYAKIMRFEFREVLARVKAWLEVELFRPEPTFLGKKIPIEGDGRVTH